MQKDKSRRPAGEAGRAANHEGVLKQNPCNTRQTAEQAPAAVPAKRRLSVSDGHETVGFIEYLDGRYCALDLKGRVIGHFELLLQATRSVPKREAAR